MSYLDSAPDKRQDNPTSILTDNILERGKWYRQSDMYKQSEMPKKVILVGVGNGVAARYFRAT